MRRDPMQYMIVNLRGLTRLDDLLGLLKIPPMNKQTKATKFINWIKD